MPSLACIARSSHPKHHKPPPHSMSKNDSASLEHEQASRCLDYLLMLLFYVVELGFSRKHIRGAETCPVHLFVPFSKTWGQPQMCVACCFKMGLCRNASSHAHSTTLLIHCIELQSSFSTCAQHWPPFLLLIAILKHVHGLSRHQFISLCCHLFCVNITVVHHSFTVQHLFPAFVQVCRCTNHSMLLLHGRMT